MWLMLTNSVNFSLAPVSIQLTNKLIVSSEDHSMMTFRLVLSGPVDSPFAIEVCTRNGSALG